MAASVESNNSNKGDDRTFELEFDELLRTSSKRFHRLALRFVKNHHDAEDVVQSAIADLLQRRASGEIIGAPLGFLITAIAHTAINVRNQKEYRKQFQVNNVECDWIAAPEKDNDRYAEVRAAMDKMKPKLKHVLNLCCLEGYSIREAAKILQRPSASVATDLYRAKW